MVATMALIGGGIWLIMNTENASKINASQNASAIVDQTSHDWGKIAYKGGVATKEFTITNAGTDVLKLSKIKTSCVCTKAYITINGVKSPNFDMHTTSSWVGEVPAGGKALLTVVFDPAFHGPSGVGAVNRIISITTNDAKNPVIEFSLTGEVLK